MQVLSLIVGHTAAAVLYCILKCRTVVLSCHKPISFIVVQNQALPHQVLVMSVMKFLVWLSHWSSQQTKLGIFHDRLVLWFLSGAL